MLLPIFNSRLCLSLFCDVHMHRELLADDIISLVDITLHRKVKTSQCKSSGGPKFKCGIPVPNLGYARPRHQPLNKKAQWSAIDDAEARSVNSCALERTLLFINFLLCALKFQHICVNNCKSTYLASLIWLEI